MKIKRASGLVKRLRTSLGLSRRQFARRIGVTYDSVSNWENGRCIPQKHFLRHLLDLRAELEHEGENPSDDGTRVPGSPVGKRGILQDEMRRAAGH